MVRIRLPEADAQALEQAFRQATDRKFRDRLRIIRLANRGRPHRDIAAGLGITPRTVPRWLNRYLESGLAGLQPRKAEGAQARVPPGMAEEVRRRVIGGPAQQGLDRADWTHAELAEPLYRTHGIRASRSAMQRFCQRLDIRVDRPTYRFGDVQEQVPRSWYSGPAFDEASRRAGPCLSRTCIAVSVPCVRGRCRTLTRCSTGR